MRNTMCAQTDTETASVNGYGNVTEIIFQSDQDATDAVAAEVSLSTQMKPRAELVCTVCFSFLFGALRKMM